MTVVHNIAKAVWPHHLIWSECNLIIFLTFIFLYFTAGSSRIIMDTPHDCKSVEEIKDALQNNNQALAIAKIQEYLDRQNNIPLNIAITGETGSGKSTFINAFRGIKDGDAGAAPTGVRETTKKPTPYPHPNYPNVTLDVGFEKFDFFIILSDTRFRENDVKLAREVQRMKKKFYFVRSKIDNDYELRNAVRGSPQVFLVSSFELHLHDFSLLTETLERELPEHKRNALLFAMPNISQQIINKKKEAFQAKIKWYASLSAVGAAVPVPGLSIAVDAPLLAGVVTQYVFGFGLDRPSLKRLAEITGVPFDDLMTVIISPLAARKNNR
uniref:IRG-type G domain-containing protein n=1 Tax=Sparus aurata TaxID=8175 RepID=A0A671U6F1_SPAAU